MSSAGGRTPRLPVDAARRGWFSLVAALVVGLSACASPPPVVGGSPSPSATVAASAPQSSTPPAAPTPTASSDRSAVIAFGGDCDALIDVATLSATLGRDLAAETDVTSIGVRTLGGLECVWRAPDLTAVRAYALPFDVVPADDRASYDDGVVCEGYLYDGAGCRTAVTDDATWLLVTVDDHLVDGVPASQSEVSAEVEELAPLFRQALAATSPPRAAVPGAGWWTSPTCTDLGDRLDLAGILGSEEFQSGYPSAFGTDVPATLAVERGTTIDCKWYASWDDGFAALVITAYPGAAADWERMQEGWSSRTSLTPVDVAGAQRAFEGTGGIRPDRTFVIATDGVNLLQVTEAPDPVGAAAAAIDALSGG